MHEPTAYWKDGKLFSLDGWQVESGIVDGKPVTPGFNNRLNDLALLTDCPAETRAAVIDWITDSFLPVKARFDFSSYSLKHWLHHDLNIYLTNNQYKHAMMLAGWEPIDSHELNWHYGISKRSPVILRRRRELHTYDRRSKKNDAGL